MGRSFYGMLQPYITIVLANGVSLTWNAKDGRPDYFTSLKHTRYTHQANVATINLTYSPVLNNDPNFIEKALVASKGYCTYQYGFAGQKSHVYRGMITDYKTNISNGVLTYSIELVSQSVLYNFKTITKDSAIFKYTTEDRRSDGQHGTEKSTTVFGEWINEAGYMRTGSGNNGTVDDYDFVASFSLQFMKALIDNTECSEKYEFDLEESSSNFKVVSVLDVVGMSPIKALIEIAKVLVDREDPNKYFYKIVVDDNVTSGSKGKIYLRRMSSDSSGSRKRYVFEWGDKNCDVISWVPGYKGTAMIYDSSSKGEDGSTESSTDESKSSLSVIGEDENGYPTAAQVDTPAAVSSARDSGMIPNDPDSVQLQSVREINEYQEMLSYSYEGTLTVIGVPDDIELCQTLVEVVPTVNGVAHHSAGLYLVKGVTDDVSSSGFTTTLQLVKYADDRLSKEGDSYYITYSDGTKVEVRDYRPEENSTSNSKE